jgi:hypothetical protein
MWAISVAIFAAKNLMKFTRLLIALVLFCGVAQARIPGPKKVIPKVDLGVKVGASFDNMHGTGWNTTYRTGYHGGVFLGFREQVFGVQGEVLVNSTHYTLGTTTEISNLCLDVPVMFQFRLVPRLWVQVGPQYSILLSSKYAATDKATNFFKPGAFSGVAGLQMLLPLNLMLGGRYVLGLSDWDNVGSAPWKQRSVQLFAGVRLL